MIGCVFLMFHVFWGSVQFVFIERGAGHLCIVIIVIVKLVIVVVLYFFWARVFLWLGIVGVVGWQRGSE